MKKILFLIGVIFVAFVATGCDKSDYQHPMHRSGGK